MEDFRLILETFLKITTFSGFSSISWWFSGFNILKVIFESNSLSINKKKNHIYIKCSLLIKHCILLRQKYSIFIQLWRKRTKLFISNDYSFFRAKKFSTIFQKSFTMSNVHGYWKWFAEINDSTPHVLANWVTSNHYTM